MRETTKKHTLNLILDVVFWVIGSIIYAIAINVFSVPNHLSLGGFTGIATILNSLFLMPVGTTILILNIPFFIISLKKFGVGFIIKTIVATALTSVFIDLLSPFVIPYSGDTLLAAIFCGVLSGVGLAIILTRGATTGGTDIIAKLIRLKYSHISIGKIILAVDAFVAIASGIVYKSFESTLYSAIVIFISSRTIDYIVFGAGGGKMLLVITNYGDLMAKTITNELARGVTLLPAKGGFTGDDKNMLMCAIRPHEISRLNRIIRAVDESAFVIVTDAGEIFGEGFTKGN